MPNFKLKHLILYLLTLCMFCTLAGCTAKGLEPSSTAEAPTHAPSPVALEAAAHALNQTAQQGTYTPYTLYVTDENYTLGLYEPAEGCYSGAYILSDKQVNFDIDTFEEKMGVSHGVYMYNMNLGDSFPLNWVLSCVASMKTPYVAVHMVSPLSETQWAVVEETAQAFGAFYVPMFVELNMMDKTSKASVDDYQRAAAVFKKHASNAALVWSIDAGLVSSGLSAYPGNDYVDWVGLNLMKTLEPDDKYKEAGVESLNFFYYAFQKQKPLMISRFGVSHLNSRDYVYHTQEAATEIEQFYSLISKNYPRIKCINYMDFNGIELSGRQGLSDDFTITAEDAIIEAYGRGVSKSYFINELAVSSFGDLSPAAYTSPFDAYKIGEDFYVAENSLRYDFLMQSVEGLGEGILIDGEQYFNVSRMGQAAGRLRFASKED